MICDDLLETFTMNAPSTSIASNLKVDLKKSPLTDDYCKLDAPNLEFLTLEGKTTFKRTKNTAKSLKLRIHKDHSSTTRNREKNERKMEKKAKVSRRERKWKDEEMMRSEDIDEMRRVLSLKFKEGRKLKKGPSQDLLNTICTQSRLSLTHYERSDVVFKVILRHLRRTYLKLLQERT